MRSTLAVTKTQRRGVYIILEKEAGFPGMLLDLDADCAISQALRSILLKQTRFMFSRRTIPYCLLSLHAHKTARVISVYTYINHIFRSSLGDPWSKMDFASGKQRWVTSGYCVIRSMTHVVDWDQVLHRIHLSKVVHPWVTGKVTAQWLLAKAWLPYLPSSWEVATHGWKPSSAMNKKLRVSQR